jgi:hypothetical protein
MRSALAAAIWVLGTIDGRLALATDLRCSSEFKYKTSPSLARGCLKKENSVPGDELWRPSPDTSSGARQGTFYVSQRVGFPFLQDSYSEVVHGPAGPFHIRNKIVT